LRAHLAQLVLHAAPDAGEVDRGHAVKALGRLVGRVADVEHDAGVVEGHVEPTEGVDGATAVGVCASLRRLMGAGAP
jgi:hypothetical protein